MRRWTRCCGSTWLRDGAGRAHTGRAAAPRSGRSSAASSHGLLNDVREIAARVEISRSSRICRSVSAGRSPGTRSIDTRSLNRSLRHHHLVAFSPSEGGPRSMPAAPAASGFRGRPLPDRSGRNARFLRGRARRIHRFPVAGDGATHHRSSECESCGGLMARPSIQAASAPENTGDLLWSAMMFRDLLGGNPAANCRSSDQRKSRASSPMRAILLCGLGQADTSQPSGRSTMGSRP